MLKVWDHAMPSAPPRPFINPNNSSDAKTVYNTGDLSKIVWSLLSCQPNRFSFTDKSNPIREIR